MKLIKEKLLVTILFQLLLFQSCTQNNTNNVNNMPLNNKSIQKTPSQDTTYSIYIFETTDLGWGYDIIMNEKVIIHQTNIPGVTGNHGFHTKEDAQVIANFVLYKISKNIFPPSISNKELDSLINYKP